MTRYKDKTITRALLSQKLAQRCHILDLITAQHVINLFCQKTIEALAQDKDVTLRGFGTFRSKIQPARLSRNPRTNKKIDVSSRRLAFFKPSKVLSKTLTQERTT